MKSPDGQVRVLIVEDDPAIAEAVLYALQKDGMQAETALSLAAARARLGWAHLVVLDLVLGDGSGYSLLRETQRLADPPRVLVLTSRDAEVDCVAALEAGADDFVTKPFSPRALVARVRAILRRGALEPDEGSAPASPASPPSPPSPPSLTVPHARLTVDASTRRVTYAGVEVSLTKIEFDLVAALAASPGRVHTRDQLVEKVWGNAYALTPRTVDSHFKVLRRKLEEAGAPEGLIETVRAVGFRLREGR